VSRDSTCFVFEHESLPKTGNFSGSPVARYTLHSTTLIHIGEAARDDASNIAYPALSNIPPYSLSS
jgi:hypothetical protein